MKKFGFSFATMMVAMLTLCVVFTSCSSEEDDETQAMLRQLYRMINRLGQLEKSIILLYLEEKSYEEIAEITGLTITNVATKLNRIKDKLKKMNKEE